MLVDRYKIYKSLIFHIMFFILCSTASGEEILQVENTYRFFYNREDSLLVLKLVEKIKPSLQTLEQFFGKKPVSPIAITLTKSESEYMEKAQVKIPEWSQAIAFTKQGRIILNLSTAEAIRVSPGILIHELFHILLADVYPDAEIPVWLNEGLAQYFAGENLSFEDKRNLATALSTGKLIDLAALDSVLTFGPIRARLAYIEARSAVEMMVQQHGLTTIGLLLEAINLSADLDKAFLHTLGYDFLDFEIRWNEYLKDHYEWLVILNFDNVLWLSIGFLFILALIVKKLRNRRVVKNWDEDEIVSPD